MLPQEEKKKQLQHQGLATSTWIIIAVIGGHHQPQAGCPRHHHILFWVFFCLSVRTSTTRRRALPWPKQGSENFWSKKVRVDVLFSIDVIFHHVWESLQELVSYGLSRDMQFRELPQNTPKSRELLRGWPCHSESVAFRKWGGGFCV